MLCRLAGERTIEHGPPVGLDLGLEILAALEVTSRPELSRGEMRGAGAQAVADVVTVNYQVAAIMALTPHDYMDVRVVCIPVIDSDPIELGVEIPLGLCHQVPGERP